MLFRSAGVWTKKRPEEKRPVAADSALPERGSGLPLRWIAGGLALVAVVVVAIVLISGGNDDNGGSARKSSTEAIITTATTPTTPAPAIPKATPPAGATPAETQAAPAKCDPIFGSGQPYSVTSSTLGHETPQIGRAHV